MDVSDWGGSDGAFTMILRRLFGGGGTSVRGDSRGDGQAGGEGGLLHMGTETGSVSEETESVSQKES